MYVCMYLSLKVTSWPCQSRGHNPSARSRARSCSTYHQHQSHARACASRLYHLNGPHIYKHPILLILEIQAEVIFLNQCF